MDARHGFLGVYVEQLAELVAGFAHIFDAECDLGNRDGTVRMAHQMWLPEHVTGLVIDENQFCFREHRRVDGDIVEGRAAGFFIIEAERGVALQPSRRLYAIKARREDLVAVLRFAAAEGDDMGTFVLLQQCLGRTVEIGVCQAHDLKVALFEHRTVIAGPEGFNRTARLARPGMNAPRRQREPKFVISLTTDLKVFQGEAHVVQFERQLGHLGLLV